MQKPYNDKDDNSWSEELRTKHGIRLFYRARVANFGEYLSHADVIYLNRPRRTGSLGVNVWSSQDINVIVEKKEKAMSVKYE